MTAMISLENAVYLILGGVVAFVLAVVLGLYFGSKWIGRIWPSD